MKTCEICGDESPNAGPFHDNGRTWKLVCVRCKMRIALTPERKERLAREIEAILKAEVQ